MDQWFSMADVLINNYDEISDFHDYNEMIFLKNQATNLLPFVTEEYKAKLNKIINSVDGVICNYNKENINNEIDTNESQTFSEALVVLGSKDNHEQSKRVNSLYEYIKTRENPESIGCILFSGGGYDVNKSESISMMDEFLSIKSPVLENIKCALICEEDSLDTVGNALFSRYILNNYKICNIKVFTSTFHVPRTYNIFSRVFNPSSLSVIGTNDYNFDKKIIESEFKSNFLSDESIFTMKCGELDIKLYFNDWRTLMIQLFLNHDLYKKRYDLMRKYLIQLESESF